MESTNTPAVATSKRTSSKGTPTPAQQIAELRTRLDKLRERGESSTSKGKATRRALRKLGWYGGSRTRTSTDSRIKPIGKIKPVKGEASAKRTVASKASAKPVDASKRTKRTSRTSAAERAANRTHAAAVDAAAERSAPPVDAALSVETDA